MEGFKVAKFGGSSLSDASQFRRVRNIINDDIAIRFVVVSAPGKRYENDCKITDKLIECSHRVFRGLEIEEQYSLIRNRFTEIASELSVDLDITTHLDRIEAEIKQGADSSYIASRGEYLCALILSSFLQWDMVDAADCICFDGSGKLDLPATDLRVMRYLSNHKVAIIPGFYGSNPNGEIRVFPRNGSDISGALIARGMHASVYENWTDVTGFLMADPKIVHNPKKIEYLSYQELRDLSYMGASILHEDAIFPVSSLGIPTVIKNTNMPKDLGTFISENPKKNSPCLITGIAGKKGFAIIHLEKALLSADIGYARKLLQLLEEYRIPLEHLACGIDSISIIVRESYLDSVLKAFERRIVELFSPEHFSIHKEMAIITVVGRGLKKDKGKGKASVFDALAKSGVNTWFIDQGARSENIYVGVDDNDFELSIRAIYDEFVR